MKYLRIFIGLIKSYIYSLISLGAFSFKFPIRFCKNASVECGNGGKVILGKHVSLNRDAHLYVTNQGVLKIGSYTGIGDHNVIVAREKIEIGDNVMIGPNVEIYDHDHVFKTPGVMRNLGYNTAPVIIEDNVWLGAGVIVLKGVTIGEGSVIAAGTIVNKDIPKNSIVYNKKELIIKERIEGI